MLKVALFVIFFIGIFLALMFGLFIVSSNEINEQPSNNSMTLEEKVDYYNSGYYRVSKQKDSAYKQGFIWKYQYTENGKHKAISSVDIKKLEKKVKDKGLKWEKI